MIKIKIFDRIEEFIGLEVSVNQTDQKFYSIEIKLNTIKK